VEIITVTAFLALDPKKKNEKTIIITKKIQTLFLGAIPLSVQQEGLRIFEIIQFLQNLIALFSNHTLQNRRNVKKKRRV
jgi:hypothetical protein